MTSNIKRTWGGIGVIDTDSDDEIEIDTSATLTSGALDISFAEHVSKRQKQHHSTERKTERDNFGATVEEHEAKPRQKQVCHIPYASLNCHRRIVTDLTDFYRVTVHL
jgi:hypothetical protein